MSEISLNTLDNKQRRIVQIAIVLVLCIFLGAFFWIRNEKLKPIGSSVVALQNKTLDVFNDTYEFKGYPNKILFHFPYLLYIEGDKPLTHIYNLETKEQVDQKQDVLLDYYNGNVLYNRKTTFYNNKDLGEFCDFGFIKSESEILCITKESQNYTNNILISINPDTPNLWKEVYKSKSILTSVSVIENTLYIGEINMETKQSYLTIGEQTTEVDSPVSLIYEMRGKPYFATFRSALSESNKYYESSEGKFVNVIDVDQVIFYDY